MQSLTELALARSPTGVFTRVEVAAWVGGTADAEAALAFHGWLTEAVETVTSACDARGRRFQTPIGGFSFDRVECVDF